MPPLAQVKANHATNDVKVKKTKSRNGCGRCKIKRLKCDETAPGCLQCKRRNVACPGYEKTLKWSTKYEVFQPTHFAPAPHKNGSTAIVTKASPKEKSLQVPPDMERHFEALAAVLPAGKQPDAAHTETHQQSPPPMVVGSLTSSEDSTPEPSDGSPPELDQLPEPLFFDDPLDLDPLMMDDLVDAMGMPDDDLTFGPLDGFDIGPGPSECIDYNAEEPSQAANDDTGSSPRLSRSLLLDFYRLPSPSPSSTADDLESVLVQHYFKEVCGRFSCFDSHLNPFRTTIGRIYQHTPSIYYGIMSMAAAHLANTFPYMAQLGVDMQRKARDALLTELPLAHNDSISCTKAFLSTMLLGTTTGWHDNDILGEEFLSAARSLILPKLLNNAEGDGGKQRETQFFEESLIYWEMLMGFVNPDAMTFAPSGLRSRPKKIPSARKPDGKIMPHPWTGIAPTIMILFAEVGRLVRRERMRDGNASVDFRRHHENLLNAATLEEDLLAAEYPTTDEIAELGDERTSKQDFVAVAEAYRCAGLLEIYRVFPSILRKRLGTKDSHSGELVDFNTFPMPRFETAYEDTDTKLWLNSLAMHILDLIDSIPSSSGTICIQHILIVSAASELRFVSSVDFFDVYANDTRVCQSREFAVKRLQEYSRRLPAKPFRGMIDLVKEVWRRQDNGDSVFWVDVIDEQGYKSNPFVR